jgi:hypothetical protein
VVKHPRESASTYELNMKLFNACRNGDIASVRQAVAEGADVDFVYDLGDGITLMQLAIVHRYGEDEVAKVLIECGADVDVQMRSGKTALHFAVEHMNPVILKVLIDAGADPDLCDTSGETAADYAKRRLPDAAALYSVLAAPSRQRVGMVQRGISSPEQSESPKRKRWWRFW